jgi:hypothetical protein
MLREAVRQVAVKRPMKGKGAVTTKEDVGLRYANAASRLHAIVVVPRERDGALL